MPRARVTRSTEVIPEATPEEAAVPDTEAAPEATEVTAMVTAAAPEEEDENAPAEAFFPDVVAAAVTAAVDPADSDMNPELPEVPAPTRAGTVEVRVLHVAFPFQDKDGNYQVLKQGETGKVTAAQAARAEALGAVERV